MRLIYKGLIVLVAALSAAHAGDYAYYLWRGKKRTAATVIGTWCVCVITLAVYFAWHYD